MNMKPVRGSARASSQAPQGKKHNRNRAAQEAGPCGRSTKHQVAKPSRIRGAETGGPKVKGKEMWRPLSTNSITALENLLSLSILSVLTLKQKNKEECQKHLNILKDRFLASCAQLKVPPQKHGTILQGSRLYQVEARKAAQSKQNLDILEAQVTKVVRVLEEMEGKMNAVEQENRSLRSKLEKEEEHSHQFLSLALQDVLHLPSLMHIPEDKHLLQERLPGMLVDTGVATCLAEDLLSARVAQEVRDFLELAHGQADGLLSNGK